MFFCGISDLSSRSVLDLIKAIWQCDYSYVTQRGKYHLVAYYSKRLPEAVANYSISELELTGVMANVAAFKHLLRNANFHVYCDHSALVHILKAKREPPTLRLKKLIENLSEYKFDIYFLKGKEMHISDFLS